MHPYVAGGERKSEREIGFPPADMDIELAKRNVGFYFTIGLRRCKVVKADRFGDQVHYGFVSVDKNQPINGWIHADFVGGCELTP